MTTTINKTELARRVADTMDGTLQQGTDALTAVLESIADCLCDGHDISLVGFGTFKVQERAAREGRNPQTGETIQIAASKTIRVKIGKALKERLND